jgi:HSP20 family protein
MLHRGFFDDILGRMFRDWSESFPWDEETRYLRERDPFEAFGHLIDSHFERFRKGIPSQFIQEREIPGGRVTTVGPIYYGISYKKEPGKDPEVREFGNVKPSLGGRRLELAPQAEREPIVEVVDEADRYTCYIELPGVRVDSIDLEASQNSLKVKAANRRKYATEIGFEEPVDPDPDRVEASYKDGELTVTLSKRKGGMRRISVEG